jgi:type VI secretion system protein ImpF
MNAMPAGPLVPLFDRLTKLDDAGEESRVPDAAGLSYRLRNDLVRLFNVRNGATIEQYLETAQTPVNYGLPDTMGLCPQSVNDLQRLELVVVRAIALHEPRLIQARVIAKPDPVRPAAALITISALATLSRQLQQVQFDLVLDGQSMRASAPESQP